MAQHSPGPWELGPSLEDHGGWRVYSDHSYRVAEVPNVNGSARNEANAKLIAAAPEMLVALQGMLSEWDQFTRYGSEIAKSANERINFARSVVEKVEAQS